MGKLHSSCGVGLGTVVTATMSRLPSVLRATLMLLLLLRVRQLRRLLRPRLRLMLRKWLLLRQRWLLLLLRLLLLLLLPLPVEDSYVLRPEVQDYRDGFHLPYTAVARRRCGGRTGECEGAWGSCCRPVDSFPSEK